MEVQAVTEKSSVDLSAPETSDLNSSHDSIETEREMVIEESPVKEQSDGDMPETLVYASGSISGPESFGSPTFESQSGGDRFETAAVETVGLSSPESGAVTNEPKDDQMMDDLEEDRILLDLTEEEITETSDDHGRILDLTGEEEEAVKATEEHDQNVEMTENEENATAETGTDQTEEHDQISNLTDEEEIIEETTIEEQTEEHDQISNLTDEEEVIEEPTAEDQPEDEGVEADETENLDREDQTRSRETDEVREQTPEPVIEAEEQTLAEEEPSENKTAETEDSKAMEPEMSAQVSDDEKAECSAVDLSMETTVSPAVHADSETLPETTKKTDPTTSKPKSAVRRKKSKEKTVKAKRKVAKARPAKVAVPTVTVTAPSDQSDDSDAARPSPASTPADLAGLPRRIETTDKLPPGWKRVAIMRLGGKLVGRYDTSVYSETNFKMRSFPNVKTYLQKTGQLHFLDNAEYDFKFFQPFSTPKVGRGRPRSAEIPPTKSPATGSVKASKNKTPAGKASRNRTPAASYKSSSKSDMPATAKVCMTLKRKIPLGANGSDSPSGGSGSPDLSNIWEVKRPPKAQGRKKTTSALKKDSPQLKLDALITKIRASPAMKESKFKSGFKTVLHKTPLSKKVDDVTGMADESIASSVAVDPSDEFSEKSESVVDLVGETKEAEENVDRAEAVSDEHTPKIDEDVSDVYLAEEQEEPYKSDEEEPCVSDRSSENMEMEGADAEMEGARVEASKDTISEDCLSEETPIFEVKSEKSDNDSDTKLSDAVTTLPMSDSRTTALKRSLSPSDSDVSARKRARMWREADTEEDSSRSVGMCSDTSLPPQEEEENQNMASKVQKMHLSDSSSSRDIKDSASTSSSNCSSLAPASSLLSPSWRKSRMRDGPAGQSGGQAVPKKSLAAYYTSSPELVCAEKSLAVKTNGASSTVPQQKRHRDSSWNPPRSPFNLIQERLYHDPWKLLVGTIFLQEVEAKVAIPLLWKFLNRWPQPKSVQASDTEHIARLLRPMRKSEMCAATVVRFSQEYVSKDWNYPIELHGIEKYGNDSFRIFCIKEWNEVTPDDYRLIDYCQWLSRNRVELGVE